MSIQLETTRIITAKNTLSTKGQELGLTLSTDKIDAIATKLNAGLVKVVAPTATVQEGQTYTIPAGYHDGTGTVSGVAGGGEYDLESRTVTPTKSQQAITPSDGYYGLADVTVEPIPDAFQNTSSVTATAGDVLATKIFVTSDGTVTTGTMVNNGSVTATFDGLSTTSYTIPAGYHDGTGTVSLTDDIENTLASI